MAQITSGIRTILSHPRVYDLAQRIFGTEKARRALVQDFFPKRRAIRMLDIGCGTGEILQYLPEDMIYFGFDASEAYISQAKERFGHRGEFRAEYVRQATLADLPPFDLVLAFGVLHHLADEEGNSLFRLAKDALIEGGKLITIDATYTAPQSSVARWIISKDRGQNVRTPDGYLRLAETHFASVRQTVRNDLMHIPYSHLIMECC